MKQLTEKQQQQLQASVSICNGCIASIQKRFEMHKEMFIKTHDYKVHGASLLSYDLEEVYGLTSDEMRQVFNNFCIDQFDYFSDRVKFNTGLAVHEITEHIGNTSQFYIISKEELYNCYGNINSLLELMLIYECGYYEWIDFYMDTKDNCIKVGPTIETITINEYDLILEELRDLYNHIQKPIELFNEFFESEIIFYEELKDFKEIQCDLFESYVIDYVLARKEEEEEDYKNMLTAINNAKTLEGKRLIRTTWQYLPYIVQNDLMK